MYLSRRRVLQACVGAAVVSAVPVRSLGLFFPEVAGALPVRTNTRGIAGLTMASFTPYVNTPFRFTVKLGQSVVMPLSAVTDQLSPVAGRMPTAHGECFSLTFNAPRRVLPQGTYAVDHLSLGHLSLFVVPVGRKDHGQDYQAVINRVTR